MKSALIRLREAREGLRPSEQNIADFVLESPGEAAEMSIHAFADKTYTSPSTIVRFFQHLGFEGYRDFRRLLCDELAIREDRRIDQEKEISVNDSITDIISKITYKNMVSLEETSMLLDAHTLQQCVDLLRQCRVMRLFGIGASLCVIQDAYLKFLRLNKPCIINTDWHSQLVTAKNASQEDFAIVVSYSGQTVEMVECMKALRKNQTPILAITRCVPSPVARLADFKLYTTSKESLFRTGAMASRISQLNIFDILYTAYANRDYEHSMQQIKHTYIQKPTLE